MAFARPINLGQAQTTIGGATAIDPRVAALLQAQAKPGDATPAAAPPGGGYDQMYAISQALSNTPRVEGTNPLEAVAAALTGGLRGRMAQREHNDEVKQTARQAELADALAQRQQAQWNTADKQDARLNDWAATQGPEAQVDPRAAFSAHQQADALSHQPMTPYQAQTSAEMHRHNLADENRSAGGGAPPSGYRWTPDRNLEVIPGGPGASRSQMAAVRARSSFFREPVPHAYQQMRTMWPRVQAFLNRTNNGTAANIGDPALQADLLDAYVQMMNGGRQITEQQVHNISQYQGTVAQAQQALNRLTQGDTGGVLTPATVRSLIATARAYRQQLSGQYPAEVDRLSRRVAAMGMQPTEVLDPAELIPDPEDMAPAPAAGGAAPPPGGVVRWGRDAQGRPVRLP